MIRGSAFVYIKFKDKISLKNIIKSESLEISSNNLYAAYWDEKQKKHTELERAWRSYVS